MPSFIPMHLSKSQLSKYPTIISLTVGLKPPVCNSLMNYVANTRYIHNYTFHTQWSNYKS